MYNFFQGDIFERLGKAPPSVDEKMRRKALNRDGSDDTGNTVMQ